MEIEDFNARARARVCGCLGSEHVPLCSVLLLFCRQSFKLHSLRCKSSYRVHVPAEVFYTQFVLNHGWK